MDEKVKTEQRQTTAETSESATKKNRFGRIKSDPAKRSNRHGKFLTPNSEMDELLKESTDLKPVKSDSKSLSRYSATIMV